MSIINDFVIIKIFLFIVKYFFMKFFFRGKFFMNHVSLQLINVVGNNSLRHNRALRSDFHCTAYPNSL